MFDIQPFVIFGSQHSSFSAFGMDLKAVALKAAVKSRAAQAKRLRGLADVAVEARHRLLDQKALDVFEAHVLEPSAAGVLARTQSEIGRLDERSRRHQD